MSSSTPTTGKRWPIWVEIDSNAADPAKAALEIHPAVNFASGHRYIVALRNLQNAAGEEIEAPAAFRYYRDKVPSKQDEINARRKHFKGIFKTLRRAGIDQQTSTWPGTSPSPATRTTPAASSRCATTPSPSSATPTSPT